MARSAGVEPTTDCLEGSCSIQLSYERADWTGAKVLNFVATVNGVRLNRPRESNYPLVFWIAQGRVGWERGK